MKQKEFTIDFEIKITKRDAVSKSTMRKVFDYLFKYDHKTSYDAFITDNTGRMYLFTFERNPSPVWYGFDWDFSVNCDITESEGNTPDDVMTSYCCMWLNGQHRKVDHEFSEYNVER